MVWLVLENDSQTVGLRSVIVKSYPLFSQRSETKTNLIPQNLAQKSRKLSRLLRGVRHAVHNITQTMEWFSLNLLWEGVLKTAVVRSFVKWDAFYKVLYPRGYLKYYILIKYVANFVKYVDF
jgi:hypothetical protein